MKNLCIGLSLLLAIFPNISCNYQKNSAPIPKSTETRLSVSSRKAQFSIAAETVASPKIAAGDVAKKVIKTARVSCQVKDTEKATEQVNQWVSRQGGYLASNSVTSGSFSIDSELQIRVPSENFDVLLGELLSVASFVESKVIEVTDETEEFVDLTARLKTQKEIEQKYLEILKQAKKVDEILAVEKQLGEIREEIESREGRLQLLLHQVQYSTIHLKLSEKLKFQRPPQAAFFVSIWESFKTGWTDFLEFIIGLIELWPFAILLFGFVFLFRRWIRLRRARRNKSAT